MSNLKFLDPSKTDGVRIFLVFFSTKNDLFFEKFPRKGVSTDGLNLGASLRACGVLQTRLRVHPDRSKTPVARIFCSPPQRGPPPGGPTLLVFRRKQILATGVLLRSGWTLRWVCRARRDLFNGAHRLRSRSKLTELEFFEVVGMGNFLVFSTEKKF